MSRDLASLNPRFRPVAESVLKKADGTILIYCTYRSLEEQARLFRQGRILGEIKAKGRELREQWHRPDLEDILLGVGPQKGPRVTWAGPGQSFHNYGLAFDAVPVRNGDLVWGDKRPEDLAAWWALGILGERCGAKWGGRWEKPDRPHFQSVNDDWRNLIHEWEF